MKNYTITVNGNVYDVTVEENGAGAAAPVAAPTAAPRKAAAPAVAASAADVKRTAGAASCDVTASLVHPMNTRPTIEAGAAGKVLSIDVNVGDTLKAGDTVAVLEVMKMETPVVAPKDGTVASIDAKAGDMVEAGALLATLN